MIENTISTNKNLVQDNPNKFLFGQKHNDIDCALCPTAKRACDRAWVTAKQIENWSKMSTTTLWRRLNDLEECERISRLSDLTNVEFAGIPLARTTYLKTCMICRSASRCLCTP